LLGGVSLTKITLRIFLVLVPGHCCVSRPLVDRARGWAGVMSSFFHPGR
jgi:hypothetical protein